MPILVMIAGFFGISVFRLVAYAAIVIAVVTALGVVRQHYVNLGWKNAITAVKKQDNRAIEAAEKVEERASKCDESSGYWDVITQNCKLQEEGVKP